MFFQIKYNFSYKYNFILINSVAPPSLHLDQRFTAALLALPRNHQRGGGAATVPKKSRGVVEEGVKKCECDKAETIEGVKGVKLEEKKALE